MVPQPTSPTSSLTDSEKNDYHYISRKDKLIATSTSNTNLYIRGLDENTTDKDLYDMCEK
jgi:RNA recognition motif-containing protein